MNFYTLTFKKKLLLVLGALLAIMIVLDIALYFVAEAKTTKTTFINDKFSKIKHFKENATAQRDIVFVGSSRTFFNISTNVFKEKGIDIYNFGISGAQFEDYPTIIADIIKHPPKEVIISLTVTRLFDQLNISGLPTIEEAKYYYDIDKKMALQSLLQWGINQHLFLVHSETIYYKLQSIYNKFNPKTGGNKTIKKEKNYSEIAECNVFDVQHTGDILSTLKCQNGDGALIGNHITLKDIKPQHLESFNPKSLQYIKKMVLKLTEHNIPVTFVFEPILHNPYTYNLKDIQKEFKNVRLIDLSSYTIEDAFWADGGHFNYKGRRQYSQYLSDIITNKGQS
ncbi:MAG TPA: hypothetical protein EYG93_05235 [Sulfurospirillum arcachonense]|nr:hypothetical protein [Sulfurospirillum arcachonense]HIP44720.1 hypothetical protein [Sulfurospirillum arcachonense]